MRKLFAVLMVFVFSLNLVGCMTTGPALPQHIVERSEKFKIGKTTYSEVIAELGEPQGAAVIEGVKRIRRIAYIDGYYGDNRINMEFDEKDVLAIKMNLKF